jgi:hypothetical protein
VKAAILRWIVDIVALALIGAGVACGSAALIAAAPLAR